MITMHPVASSNLKAIGYDPDTQEARVQFLNGSVYTYPDVPSADYEALRDAASIGQYFNRSFKKAFKGTLVEKAMPAEAAKTIAVKHQDDLAVLRGLEKDLIRAAMDASDAYNGVRGHLVVPDVMNALVIARTAYGNHPLAMRLVDPLLADEGEPSNDGA